MVTNPCWITCCLFTYLCCWSSKFPETTLRLLPLWSLSCGTTTARRLSFRHIVHRSVIEGRHRQGTLHWDHDCLISSKSSSNQRRRSMNVWKQSLCLWERVTSGSGFCHAQLSWIHEPKLQITKVSLVSPRDQEG